MTQLGLSHSCFFPLFEMCSIIGNKLLRKKLRIWKGGKEWSGISFQCGIGALKKKSLAKDDSILQESIPVFNWVVYCY